MKYRSVPLTVLCLPFLVLCSRASATPPPAFDARLLDAFVARSIGPACTGGRITAVAVDEAKPKRLYVGAANGGVWKTTNNGTTWTPVFDGQSHLSIGDVAVAPSNADIVWVGTGEANARNSVSWGNGVYKSLDGAKTWQHVGLEATAHIGRIVIHPQNPDVVYAGTDGRLYVYTGTGAPLAPLNGVRFSSLTAEATESSPVVADIDGDGVNDVVIGDELGFLTAISGVEDRKSVV